CTPLRLAALCGIALCASALHGQQDAPASAPIITLTIKGPIGVGTGMYVEQAIKTARERKASLVLLTLDTPGGLVTATREIIQSILGSPVPVAVYVAPSGARAASAGTYIVYAAHIAAMAPGTSIGAATPVAMQGPLGAPPPHDQPTQPGDKGAEQKRPAP